MTSSFCSDFEPWLSKLWKILNLGKFVFVFQALHFEFNDGTHYVFNWRNRRRELFRNLAESDVVCVQNILFAERRKFDVWYN